MSVTSFLGWVLVGLGGYGVVNTILRHFSSRRVNRHALRSLEEVLSAKLEAERSKKEYEDAKKSYLRNYSDNEFNGSGHADSPTEPGDSGSKPEGESDPL